MTKNRHANDSQSQPKHQAQNPKTGVPGRKMSITWWRTGTRSRKPGSTKEVELKDAPFSI